MRTIGITGGVGAGKSTVLALLKERFRAEVVEADKAGHLLMKPEGSCYEPVLQLLGTGILGEDGTIDRTKVAKAVFPDPALLEKLNRIIHPAVKQYILQRKKEEEDRGRNLFFIEAALFFEDHYDAICDEVWYIYADEAVRRKRLKESRQYGDERITQVMDRQLSDREFRRKCDFIVENNGNFEQTYSQIAERIRGYENM